MANQGWANQLLAKAPPLTPGEPELGFPFQILRSARRRSVSIQVYRAQVSIRAPLGVSEAALVDFLHQKQAWVLGKIAEQQLQVAAQVEPQEYRTGSELALMDERLRLVLGLGTQAAVARVGDELHLLLSSRARQPQQVQIRALLSRWYQQQALALLGDKTRALAGQMGLKCTQVSVKATRSKWGHCTSAGAIQYNWQILLAPEAVVDYLVAHEVCHLRHHNHSPAYWALVASVCPDYLALRRWLKQQGHSLHL